jgi:hypothetical protein
LAQQQLYEMMYDDAMVPRELIRTTQPGQRPNRQRRGIHQRPGQRRNYQRQDNDDQEDLIRMLHLGLYDHQDHQEHGNDQDMLDHLFGLHQDETHPNQAASQELISSFPTRSVCKNDEKEKCAVCMELVCKMCLVSFAFAFGSATPLIFLFLCSSLSLSTSDTLLLTRWWQVRKERPWLAHTSFTAHASTSGWPRQPGAPFAIDPQMICKKNKI